MYRAPCRFSQLEPAVEVRSVIMKLEVACRWRGKPAKDAQKTGAGCQEWITLANQTHHEVRSPLFGSHWLRLVNTFAAGAVILDFADCVKIAGILCAQEETWSSEHAAA